ncbi:CHAT domain-containing protein [Asanoa ferruginea]|uniref:CHAT domain-containing protein n=1 Tax=Asanoa ferruginea TaxID=53367 RepID=A0A3D9ZX69_9ACTN|nr:CHAT domain-containing protein [Asanoa ferruginea]REG01195.1 CHAT domain-containing protein [Asanoa ferruginea]GIF47095.1 CHAT domain-containing protein [Asanoa ferruginea]
MTDQAVRAALAAVDVAYTEPVRARRLAARAVADAGDDPEPVAIAERALGMARTATGDLDAAEAHFRAAIAHADRAGLRFRAGEARGSIAYVLALTGRSAEALREIDLAEPALHGVPHARLLMQRALVHTEAGRFAAAADGYGAALAALARAGGDAVLEGDIRNNRSTARIRLRDWPGAEDDLARAEAAYDAAGHLGKTAPIYHNRGLAAAARGDVPAALAAFDEAADRYRRSGRDPNQLPADRAEVLLSVLLVSEARRAAEDAVVHYAAQRNAIDLVQARVVLARAALLSGDRHTAVAEALLAKRAAQRQQRPAWAALAGYLAFRAAPATPDIRAGRRVAVALVAAGWLVEAVDARLVVARAALDQGRPAVARRELAAVRGLTAGVAGRHRTAELRARVHHAQALLHLAEGDPAGAERSLRAGLRALDEFRANLGATELRVHASGHGGELADLGVRLAFARGDARAVLGWTERSRARAAVLPPARPSDDDAFARDLAELRQAVADHAAAVAGGDDPAPLLRRQATLEDSVRRRARRAGGTTWIGTHEPVRLSALRAALGPATLVEYLALDGVLHAAVVTGGRVTLHRLGAVAEAENHLAALRHGLRRLAHSSRTAAAAATLVEHKAKQLDALLLHPLRLDGPLVIVPTGTLHALPWPALPSLTGRPVCVAPSATLWHRAATAAPAATAGPAVFVAGPGLPHATAEVTALARATPGARRFTRQSSDVESVLGALDGAGLAHLAAHGSFRADNPLFSALRLIDGPLTVYDLERLRRPPRHVVLSACDSGLQAIRPGDELLGLAAALLGMGATSLVAAVVPVPDEATRPLMLRMHRHLRAGARPAEALARAQQELVPGDPAAVGFVCYGAG